MIELWQNVKNRFIGPIIVKINTDRNWRIGLLAIVLGVIVISGIRVAFYEQKSFSLMQLSRSDFEDYLRAAQKFADGEDPYLTDQIDELKSGDWKAGDLFNPDRLSLAMKKLSGVGTYLYPPLMAFLLLPLSSLSYMAASLVYQTLSSLALLGFVYFVNRRSRNAGANERVVSLSLIFSLLVIVSFLTGNATNGNVGFFLILLSAAGLLYSFDGKTILNLVGGFLLGIAAILKITPGFLGLVLLGGRRYTAIVGMGFGALFGLILPAAGFGWSGNLDHLENWKDLIIDNYSKNAIVRPWANNQTVSGLAGKYFLYGSDSKQDRYSMPFYGGEGFGDTEHISLVANGVRAVNYTLILSGLIASLIFAYRTRKKNFEGKDALSNPGIIRLTFLAMLISLLASGVSWYHAYSVILIPLFYRLRTHLSGDFPASSLEKKFFYMLGFFGFLLSSFSSHVRDMVAMYSVFVYLGLAITGYLLWITMNKDGDHGI